MIKNIEALLRGYVLFDVNGKRFWTYTYAHQKCIEITTGYVNFRGWNIWYLFSKYGSWRSFYIRMVYK